MKKLSIELRPSRYFAAFLLLTHGGAILILLFAPWSWWGQWIASFAVVISFCMLFRRYIARQSRWSVLRARVENDGIWYLKMRSGKEYKAYLKGDSFSGEKLLVLNFRLENIRKNIPVIIFSDALDKKTFQALRTWLNLR